MTWTVAKLLKCKIQNMKDCFLLYEAAKVEQNVCVSVTDCGHPAQC